MTHGRSIDQETLLEFLDGALPVAEAEAVRDAIADSPALQHDLNELKMLRDDLALVFGQSGTVPDIDIVAAVREAAHSRAESGMPDDYFDRDDFLGEILAHADGGPAAASAASGLQRSPLHRDEYALIIGLITDLEAIGDAFARRVPTVDLADSVMATIRSGRSADNVVPMEAPRNGRRWYWAGGLGAAAAAAIALIAWFAGQEGALPDTTPAPPTQVADDAPVTPPIEPAAPTDSDGDTKRLLKEILAKIDQSDRSDVVAEAESDPATPLSTLTARGVFQLRAEAATDRLKQEQLNRLANLPPGVVGNVILAEDASSQAKLAAATMLQTERAAEAIASLRDTGVLGDDAYSHFQVALAFLAERGLGDREPVDDPSLTLEDALESITALQEQDPANALAWYMEAAARYYAGDHEGAMTALEEAGTREEASAYSGEAALASQEALEAGGMDPEAAESVAAFTSGTDEYRALLDLGMELLAMGQQYAEADPAAAESVFSSVDQMGQQLQTDAEYSYEYLAGLDLQLEAMTIFEEFWNVLGLSGDSMTALTTEAETLTGAYAQFQAAMTEINAVFLQDMTNELMNSILGVILGEGDLYLPVYFPAN